MSSALGDVWTGKTTAEKAITANLRCSQAAFEGKVNNHFHESVMIRVPVSACKSVWRAGALFFDEIKRCNHGMKAER